MKKVVVLLFIIFTFISMVVAQPQAIRIDFNSIPLNKILLELREKHGFQLAYNEDLLSNYSISLKGEFNSKEEVLKRLLEGLPLIFQRSGEVFMLLPFPEEEVQHIKPLTTRISGQVVEVGTFESLPFSSILVNNRSLQSDQYGFFNFLASADTTFNLRISHLGYFIYDTLITQSLNRRFFLVPRSELLSEITVTSSRLEYSTQIGDKPGQMKLNSYIADFLPGYGDNTIFNLLRLMPGIMAAGEQSSDLLIWGGYESHSMIRFDGFPVFGLKNFNDNISAINPFMVKNIEVLKGGYGAKYGDRVGGIVDITGINGNLQKPSFSFNINNNTLNTMLEIPASKKSSVVAAFRQTYYNLYEPEQLNLFGGRSTLVKPSGSPNLNQNPSKNGVNFTIVPDYVFRDGNLKYSLQGENGSVFNACFYYGGDQFNYSMGEINRLIKLNLFEKEMNRQFGGSLILQLPGRKGDKTSFSLSYSNLLTKREEKSSLYNQFSKTSRVLREADAENFVDEIELKAEKLLELGNGHSLESGFGLINNHISILQNNFLLPLIDLDSSSPRLFGYIQDNLPIGNRISLKSGLRMNYSTGLKKMFPEPRISFSLKANENLTLNASGGFYSQFISKSSIVDSTQNYSWFWANSDNQDIPVLTAKHIVAGLAYNLNDFIFSIEGYYKTTLGISRFFNGTKYVSRGFYNGSARSYGLDLYLKKEFGNHLAWLSYSLSKTEEHFPFYILRYYKPAPHDQRHEVKCAVIMNFGKFYVSSNYVFGSGFEQLTGQAQGYNKKPLYSRLDAAVVYKFQPGRINCETGLSVMNLFNHENIKYSNLRRIPSDELKVVGVYAEAIPFSPALFLNIKL